MMYSSLWFITFLAGVLCVQNGQSSLDFEIEDVKDICDTKLFDKCALVAQIFGHRNALIPKTMEEMNERCKMDNQIIICWRRFIRGCIKEPLSRQVVSIILQNIKKMVNLRCSDAKYQNDLFGAVNCIDQIKDKIHDRMRNFTLDLYRATLDDVDQQVPHACCSYNAFQDGAIKLTANECDESRIQFVTEFLEGYTGEILDLMCGGYEPGSPVCNELVLPEMPKNATLPESVMPPVLDILTAITKTSGKRR